MRLGLGILVLTAVAIPQTLLAQAPQAETSVIHANSSSQAAPRLQLSAVRDNVPTTLGIQQTASLLNFANVRIGPERYALLGVSEGNNPSTDVSPAEHPVPDRAVTEAAFRPTPELRKAPVRLWRALLVAQHSAAVFDAWSTRDAIQNSGAHELNPFLRPFAGSSAIYAATQVGPGLLDYLGYRMMRSKKGWMRKLWWLPQVAGTVGSLFSGAHNLVIAQGRPPNTAP